MSQPHHESPVLPQQPDVLPEALPDAQVSPDVLRSKDLVASIRENTQERLREEDILDLYSLLEKHGLERRDDFGNYFQTLVVEGTTNILLTRKENVEIFLEHVVNGTALPVGRRLSNEELGTHANAAILGSRAEGLRLAFEEGFDKSVGGKMSIVVCFDSDDLEIHGISPDSTTSLNKPNTVSLMRSVRGEISLEHIRFVAIRWPKHIFPKALMTDDELDSEGQFIIRYFCPGTVPRSIQ
jgi:hypothetical protein